VEIVVHGGAGRWPQERLEAARDGIEEAVRVGHRVLAAGGEALDAAQAAVVVPEDDPVFNAGRGSVLDERGFVLMDASVMRGRDRAAGAVAAVRGIRNPVLAARAVLDEGRHVLLVGEPAGQFAREMGLDTAPEAWLRTDERQQGFVRVGTVGAVARDRNGRLAAATSTGGTGGKHPGRVGDSPIIGAGTWADDATAAISCTGDGEAIMRIALAHEVDALVRHAGLPLEHACAHALAGLEPFGTAGLIALGADGAIATPFTTDAMPHGWCVGEGPVTVDA
jgi:isoaspartyl peptidase/L-asparaginase-like protein (Ntn-hydrolase superfamily)